MAKKSAAIIDRPDILPGIVPPFLEDYRQYLSVIYARSEKTAFEYSYHILIFFRYLALKEGKDQSDLSWITTDLLNQIVYSDIISFLSHEAARGCGTSSRSNKLTALRSFYKYLREKKLVANDPSENIPYPKQASTLPKYLTYTESRNLLDSITVSTKGNRERDFCMITLLLNCGLRRSELRAMNLDDVDGNRNILRVVGKGNKMREIPLNEACLDAIQDYLPIREKAKNCPKSEKALFVSNQGKRVSPETIEKMVQRRLLEAGIDPSRASVHTLRHTFATLTYNSTGGDIRSVQSLLGHNSLATTQIYTHINNEQLAHAVETNPLNRKTRNSE